MLTIPIFKVKIENLIGNMSIMQKRKKAALNGIITAYRKQIEKRYNYKKLVAKYDIPDSFDEDRVELFRNYFLEHIYPPPEKRAELDEAFESLDDYIKKPEKLLRILLDSGSLIFKHGRHLPKILRAGLKALKSFRIANAFERKLVNKAIKKDLTAPYSKANLEELIRSLSREDIDQFIENNRSLFDTLHDRKLVKKVQEIVDHLTKKMKLRPEIYSAKEINGLEIGQTIIKQGDLLFDQLSNEDQDQIFEYVLQIEKEFLEGLFETGQEA